MTPPPERLGFTGLDNLGNTCFMNVVIQVLANTTRIKQFFMGLDFQNDINEDNVLGSQGKLAVHFAMVLRKLWSGDSSYRPSQLKELVSRLNLQFRGYAQHDAQEFLEFLLDGLHEDLNRVRRMPFGIDPSLDDLPEEEAAKKSWVCYKARNDSFIVDQFQGQLRSQLVCPVCDKVSVTFDPYRVISVPIPEPTSKISLVFFPRQTTESQQPPVKMCIEVARKCTLHDIAEELAARTGIKSISHFEFVEVSDHLLEPLSGFTSYKPTAGKLLYAFEVETTMSAAEPVTKIYCTQRLLTSVERNQLSQCAHCLADKSEGKSIRKCTKCHMVGYCSTDCQRAHWPSHKPECKQPPPERIGQPFVLSLPASKLTFQNLQDIMKFYAKYSVQSSKKEPSATMNGDDCGVAGSSVVKEPGCFIKPVDRRWQVLLGDKGLRLKDNGTEPLKLSTQYLSLDWINGVCSKQLEIDDTDGLDADDVFEEETKLENCLTLFTKRETLSEQDSWYCPQCKTHREADKQVFLWRLPDTLIIQLKRFSFHNQFFRNKREEFVRYPVEGLDMSEFYKGPRSEEGQLYDLYGVVNHHGGLLGGHYTAYARCLNRYNSGEADFDWRLMDDSLVRTHDTSRVVSRSAYVLFYQRRTLRPDSTRLSDIITPTESTPHFMMDEDWPPSPMVDKMRPTPIPRARKDLTSSNAGEVSLHPVVGDVSSPASYDDDDDDDDIDVPTHASYVTVPEERDDLNVYETAKTTSSVRTNYSNEQYHDANPSFASDRRTDGGYESATSEALRDQSNDGPADKVKDNIPNNVERIEPSIQMNTPNDSPCINNFYADHHFSTISSDGQKRNQSNSDCSKLYTDMDATD